MLEAGATGLDDIGLTMQKAPKIDTYEDKQKSGQPWLYDTETV